jgi:hypothetical protein
MLKQTIIALTSAVAIGVSFAGSVEAMCLSTDSCQVEYDGKTYQISTVTGVWDTLFTSGELTEENQPWFSPSLDIEAQTEATAFAKAAATAVGNTFGFVNGSPFSPLAGAGQASIFFNYNRSLNTINNVEQIVGWSWRSGLNEAGIYGAFANGSFTYAKATLIKHESEPIPTPALLPGLIGMGAAALRKRKQEAEVGS